MKNLKITHQLELMTGIKNVIPKLEYSGRQEKAERLAFEDRLLKEIY